MTNREIGTKLDEKIRAERQTTNEILQLINLALERRAYLEHGYPSMFDWLVRGFKYSNAAAYRRIEAARLLKSVPEISAKLESGSVTLTTVSKAQSIIKAQEKASGVQVGIEAKAEIIEKIEGKSAQESEQVLFSLFPDVAASVQQERRTIVDQDSVRLSFNVPNAVIKKLQRAKEVLSHKFPNAGDAEILAYALDQLLETADPLLKKQKSVRKAMTRTASAAEVAPMLSYPFLEAPEKAPSRPHVDSLPKIKIRRDVLRNANASCTFKDPITGNVCGSRHQVQIDHIIPKELGGTEAPENLRALCRAHNIHAAEKIFGRRKMDKYRLRARGNA